MTATRYKWALWALDFVVGALLAAVGLALWVAAFERCDLHRIYREGDVVMVTDVPALSTASLVCRNGRWKVLK